MVGGRLDVTTGVERHPPHGLTVVVGHSSHGLEFGLFIDEPDPVLADIRDPARAACRLIDTAEEFLDRLRADNVEALGGFLASVGHGVDVEGRRRLADIDVVWHVGVDRHADLLLSDQRERAGVVQRQRDRRRRPDPAEGDQAGRHQTERARGGQSSGEAS
jgi:hypothetical protein